MYGIVAEALIWLAAFAPAAVIICRPHHRLDTSARHACYCREGVGGAEHLRDW
jgi:hypothetical protein